MSQRALMQSFSMNPLSAPVQAAQSIYHQLHFLTMSSFYCAPVSIPKPVPKLYSALVFLCYLHGVSWSNSRDVLFQSSATGLIWTKEEKWVWRFWGSWVWLVGFFWFIWLVVFSNLWTDSYSPGHHRVDFSN